jgi:hypothetical protein
MARLGNPFDQKRANLAPADGEGVAKIQHSGVLTPHLDFKAEQFLCQYGERPM